MQNNKASLVEATMLALQGKLVLKENKQIKKAKRTKKAESINVSLQDDGSTVVDTDDATVIVQERDVVPEITPAIEEPVVTEVPVECPECIETPVEEVPSIDEIVNEEPVVTDEPIEEPVEEINDEEKEEDEEDEDLNESKKVQEVTDEEIAKVKEDSKEKGLYSENKEIKTESLKTDLENLESGLYDYVANNYLRLDASELKELALNAIYVADNDAEIIKETLDRLDESKKVENKEQCEDEDCECKKEESKLKFSSKTFQKVIENYYKENYKTIKEFKLSRVLKGNSKLKIEGVLLNKFNKSLNICLEANLAQKGKSFNKYNIVETSNIMLESKNSTKMSLMTFTNKNNILECKYLKNTKKLEK